MILIPRLAIVLAALPATLPGQGLGIDATPVLVIRAESPTGTIQLDAPVTATRTREGRIIVAEQTALRVFDASGRLTATVGRAGDGPGEFRRIFWASSCGSDSVFVYDLPRRSVSALAPANTIAAVADLRQAVPAGSVTTLACAFDGDRVAVLAGPTALAEVSPGVRRGTAQVMLGDRGSWRFSAGAMVPSQEFITLGGGGAPRPLGRNTMIGFAGAGLAVGTGDSAAVLFLGPGAATRGQGLPIQPRAVTPAMRERASGELLELIPAPMRGQMQQLLSGLTWPEQAPPFLRMIPSSTAELWLELPAAVAGTTELVGVTADGRIVARVTLPVHASSAEVSASEVLVVTNDADGVPSVRVYRRR